MTAWRYIKGSEKDFEGAPDWAMNLYTVIKPNSLLKAWSNDSRYQYVSGFSGAMPCTTVCDGVFPKDWVYPVELIAQREPVATNDSKYNRPCKGITIDVYDVLKAFNVTCPALQHLIKKALAVGQRGHKDASEDLKDILASAKRAIELSEGNK